MKKRLLSILMAACLLVGLLPTVALAVSNVSYLDASGASQTCDSATEVTSGDTEWTTGWYVVTGNVTIGTTDAPQRVTVSGDIHLILADGCTLTVNDGIQVQDDDYNPSTPSPNALTVYAQSTGSSMGKLTARNAGENAAIGGNDGGSDLGGYGGDVTINGGIVEAAGSGGAGIGGGGCNLVGGGGGNAARRLLLLAVFCEKTACVLENVICGSQLGIFSLKLPDADGLLLLTHHFRRWRVSAYAAPIRQCVVRDAQLLRGFLHADLV